MSRSRKKTPIIGHTLADSEKKFKQQEHQRARSRVRDAMRNVDEDSLLPDEKNFGNPWAGDKDGKQYIGGHKDAKKLTRK